jgi:Flp pilus assembly pilin Flp
MTRWILHFLRDERGAESTELAITGIVCAGGSVAIFGELNDKLNEKVKSMVRYVNKASGD